MGRGETFFEEKAHRVAFVTEGWLNADEDISEVLTKDEDTATIGLDASRSWSPDLFNCSERWGVGDNTVGVYMGRNIGLLPVSI